MSDKMVSHRAKDFKRGLNEEDGRRKREERVIKIRKEKRADNLAKRRRAMSTNLASDASETSTNADSPVKISMSSSDKSKPELEKLDEYSAACFSTDPVLQLKGTTAIRKLLSVDSNPPAQQIIELGLVPRLVQFIQSFDSTRVVFEAAWALTNIASTSYTRIIVDCEALPHLIKLCRHVEADIREQAIWCIGNISGEAVDLRDLVLGQPDSVESLGANIRDPSSIGLLRNTVWCLSNFCRGKPVPDFERLSPFLPLLSHLISFPNQDSDVLSDALWALSYLSDGSDERIQALLDAGVAPALTRLLLSENAGTVTPALRTVGNIVSGSDSQTQHLVNNNALLNLVQLLDHEKKAIRKESCWALSNITAGSSSQIKAAMNVENLPTKLADMMLHDQWEVRKEATWAISNSLSGGDSDEVRMIVQAGCLKGLVEMLRVEDTKMVNVALDAIECVLKDGNDGYEGNIYIDALEEVDGIDAVENVQYHTDNEVFEKAKDIVEKYLMEEEDVDENIAPTTDPNSSNFTFGMSSSSLDSNNATPTKPGFNFVNGGSSFECEAAGPGTPSFSNSSFNI